MNKRMLLLIGLLLVLAMTLSACGDDDDDDDDDNDDATPGDDDDDDDDNDDNDDDDNDNDDNDDDDNDDDDTVPPVYWTPSDVVSIDAHPAVRGHTVQRGIIHLHAIYSHDACDSRPWFGDQPNQRCLDQLRAAMCDTDQQYVFLTDHAEPFSFFEFPDVLLYAPDEGDELIYEGDEPVANLMTCEDGRQLILTAGNENRVMPVGLRRMPEGTAEERIAVLRSGELAAVETMQNDLGAMVFVNHAESWTYEELAALPIRGLEIYNLHANIDPGIREEYLGLPALGFVVPLLQMLFPYGEAAHSDLMLLSFLSANTPSLESWDRLLADRRMVGILGCDAHRNSLPFPLWDGDRADSYRRMMRWFANYVLVDEFSLDAFEEAVGNGRLFGMFQAFGEPVGFDFFAETDKAAAEMGDVASLDDSPRIHVALPAFYNLDPSWAAPELTIRLYRVDADGTALVAEATDEDVTFAVTEPGAYRVEVSVVPYHLEAVLGDDWEQFMTEFPLIYANPIYVE